MPRVRRVCHYSSSSGRSTYWGVEFKKERYLLSSLTRRATEAGGDLIHITTENLGLLLKSATPPATPHVVLDDLLLDIHRRTPTLTGSAPISSKDYPRYTLRSEEELSEFIHMLLQRGFIEVAPDNEGYACKLSLRGWERVDELSRIRTHSNRAFVAMWFDKALDSAWKDAIHKALVETKWDPIRIDQVEHNARIDDKIIADIRTSGLLIADFTGQRGGVYFEAGFALGLGLPVIWTVRKSDFETLHFDTRQYNHIVWETPEELYEKLVNRIRATAPSPKAR